MFTVGRLKLCGTDWIVRTVDLKLGSTVEERPFMAALLVRMRQTALQLDVKEPVWNDSIRDFSLTNQPNQE